MTPWYNDFGTMLLIAAALLTLSMSGLTVMIRSRESYRVGLCAIGEHPWRFVGRVGAQRRYECPWCDAVMVRSRTYTVVDDGNLHHRTDELLATTERT